MSARHELDTERLYGMIDDERIDRGLSWRGVARETGLSPGLFTRMKAGEKPAVDAFLTLVLWTGAHPDELVRETARREGRP